MRSVFVLLIALLATAGLVTTAPAAKNDKRTGAKSSGPDVIALPDGWRPEGIAAGEDGSLYVGSIPTGSIYKVDPATGEGAPIVTQTDRAATGIKVDDGRIYVSGGPTGRAFVYDATTGETIADVQLTTSTTTFINDVTLTDDAAYFTDSRQQQLYRLDRTTLTATTIPITGDLQYDSNPDNNEANGIAATPDGETLYVINGTTGRLYAIDPDTGASTLMPIKGEPLTNGDGLLLEGRTLYVVENRKNRIAVVDLKQRRITGYVTDRDFDVPTTLARQGALYAVNARFGTPPTPETEYDIVKVTAAKKSKR